MRSLFFTAAILLFAATANAQVGIYVGPTYVPPPPVYYYTPAPIYQPYYAYPRYYGPAYYGPGVRINIGGYRGGYYNGYHHGYSHGYHGGYHGGYHHR